jgi:REP element-mobilizing transposase RayT
MFRRSNAGTQAASLRFSNTMTIHERIKRAKEIDPKCPWHSRGYLPHFEGIEVVQFITYRLADSLPANFLRDLKRKLDCSEISEVEYHRGVERQLDLGHGASFLRHREIASLVEENLLRFDGEKYQLLHWVIMLNHVHLLLRAINGHSLSSIMHSMKSFTANRANTSLGRTGRFWSVEYFDRYIRDKDHYANTVAYIHANPVKARLCESANGWQFSCFNRHG